MNIILIFLLIIGIIVALMYNFLVMKKNMIENIQGSIDSILKERFNLIPNLVTLLKEYNKYESNILTEITKLRTAIEKKNDLKDKIDNNDKFNKLFSQLLINVENYPELKANQNFINLSNTLKDLEDRLSAARRSYNQAVTDYNNAIEMFPFNILAKYLKYEKKEVFKVKEEEAKNINIKDIL